MVAAEVTFERLHCLAGQRDQILDFEGKKGEKTFAKNACLFKKRIRVYQFLIGMENGERNGLPKRASP